MPEYLTATPRIRQGCCILLLICLLWAGGEVRAARAQDVDAYALKAAYIFNFTKFIQWPVGGGADGDLSFHILVAGKDAVEAQFKTIDGKNNGMGIVRIERLASPTPAIDDAAQHCHVVFISDQVGESDTRRILERFAGKPILSIGEMRNFSRMGGVITLFTHNDRLAFEINLAAAKTQGLKISSRLLRLAVVVEDGR